MTLEQMLQDEIRRGIEEGMAEALAKGLEEALAEGRAEGANSEKTKIALNLLAEGLPLDLIAKATGLTEDEIKWLQK